jgi:hypothetical protein
MILKMAYKTEDLFNTAIEQIKKHKLFFIEDIIAFLPCRKSTFYEHFPNDSDSYKKMFEELELNRTQLKVALRNKWYNGNNPLTQMALYKLIGTEEEYHRIASTKTENKNINIEKPIFNGLDINVKEDAD